ncbi:hypothetical protein B0I37DRAFT_45063 [Chaetomium sp. MPI-CAGE-AT-0009]|nr:hypothetical protein B0I37DRAFT_45063 [Chaetomium sp. MPI-CAGE-AT-0009]
MAKAVIWALLALALSAPVLAGVTFTNTEYYLHAGTPFTITWTDNRGAVGVSLMKGPDENLELVLVIVSNYDGQEYVWTPPSTLPADSYILRLEDAGSADYSPRFRYPAPPPSTTTTGTGSSGQPSPTSTAPTSSAPTSTESTAPVLSTPAIAVIATLGGLLLITLIALCVYHKAYRRKRRDMNHIVRTEGEMGMGMGMGNHEMPPLSATASGPISSGTYTSYGQSLGSGTAVGGGGSSYGGGTVHMKPGAHHAGGGEYYAAEQGHQGHQGQVYERAELPVREWDDAELSAEGRHLK